jgi:hypothetical protein
VRPLGELGFVTVPLRLFEKDLANVKPEIRGLYVADVEHGFRLDCDLDEIVGGLKRALAREREINKNIKANGGTLDGLVALAVIGGTSRAVQRKPAPCLIAITSRPRSHPV